MKLFGTTILFEDTNYSSDDLVMEKEQSLSLEDTFSSSSLSYQLIKKPVESEFTGESESSNPIEVVSKSLTPSTENPKTPSFETESNLENYLKNEQSESNSENTPTKPEKILPCPRCNSMDTKFCYYNNYNLAQPRYFCKKCQRYWTSGGTMRNVPVGSGRRKNKNAFDSHNCQMIVPESFLCSQAYGKVLDFSSNPHTKPCETFVPKPNFSQKSQNSFGNNFLYPVRKEFSSGENGDDMSSITSSGSVDNKGNKYNDSVIQESVNVPNFQNNSSVMFYQSPGFWSFPCFYQNNESKKNLGLKRTREMETLSGPEEINLWCPKALRFDDPNEGANRSIWSSLRMQNEKSGIKGKVILGSNENVERYVGENSLVLQANPAALTRSLDFHEII